MSMLELALCYRSRLLEYITLSSTGISPRILPSHLSSAAYCINGMQPYGASTRLPKEQTTGNMRLLIFPVACVGRNLGIDLALR